MSIKFNKVEKEDFEANVATIYCDVTGKKMIEIIIMDSNQKNTVQAKWSDEKKVSSGLHEIVGDIYCSPIETATQKTSIINAMTDKKNGVLNHRILVKSL